MYFTPGETGAVGRPALKAELHYCHYPIARVPPWEDGVPQEAQPGKSVTNI